MDLTLSGTALDPNSIPTVDSGSMPSSTVMSGDSGGSFDWGSMITSLASDATSIIKATSSPNSVTAVKPGQTYLDAQGRIITVPSGTGFNTKTLILVGLGVLFAFFLIKRLA